MNNEEIIEYKRNCLLFLGWRETTEDFKINWVGCKTKERLMRINKEYIPIFEKNGDVVFPDFAVMDFVNDWNLIMEVKKMVQKKFYFVDILGCGVCKIVGIDGKTKNPHITVASDDTRESVVEALNQFLKNEYN